MIMQAMTTDRAEAFASLCQHSLAAGLDTRKMDDFLEHLLELVGESGSVSVTLADESILRIEADGGVVHDTSVPRAKTKLRTLCARLAVRCSEWSRREVSPYGEVAQLGLPGGKKTWTVRFHNTNDAVMIKIEGSSEAVVNPGAGPHSVANAANSRSPKTAFLFPGQGPQSVGMGRQLYETLPAARRLFDEAADILGYSLIKVCQEGPAERLNATAVSQPAIFVASLAALERLRANQPDIEASCVAAAGLSLGEYTALVFAGALSFTDGLRLVQKRGEAMQAAADAAPSGMVCVLGMDQEKVEELCKAARDKGKMEIANLLCPQNIVVSGTSAACAEVERLALEKGAFKTVRLAVAGAFHTDIMKPADQTLAGALCGIGLEVCRIPVWSNVDARPHTKPEDFRTLLVRQVVEPVLWEKTMRNLLEDGVERFFEIGPGRVLTPLLKRIKRQAECQNVPA
jgi:[acyl-carrier-protein] S-malonyltransferase